MAIVIGVGATAVTVFGLPSSTFRARAVVAIVDMTSPLATVLPRAVADASVSEPVMQRAARSLIGTSVPIPAPDLFERIAVAVGFGGAHATGREARLAADLAQSVAANPGEIPGSLEIIAQSASPDDAAQIASAAAEALIADHEATTGQARRKREIDALAQIERLRAESESARHRLAAMGGVDADPAQVFAASAAQAANVQARVDTIHAIIASGQPPLSDRRDVPAGIAALQTTYLDLTRQLATARETFGDRHTTIISLQAEVKHAAASLTSEWHRVAHLAETELAAARQREAMVRKAGTSADASRRDSIDEARRDVQIADETLLHAQTVQRETPVEERPYRLLARAAVPTAPVGISSLLRMSLAGLVGLAVFAVALLRPKVPMGRPSAVRALRREREPVETPIQADVQVEKAAVAPRPVANRSGKTMRTPLAVEPDATLMQSIADLLPVLDSIEPEFGALPTVMVAANEIGAGTMPVALAFGRAAAAIGHRVLLVEVARSRPELATAADADADPILIDLYGVLRVALPAAATDGFLYLAPTLEQGARIASALARQSETPLVDDIATEFDLIVVDGGRAADSTAAGWGADVYLRVGRFASVHDDKQFAETCGVPTSQLLGTIIPSGVAPKVQRPAVRPTPPLGTPSRAPSKAPVQGPSMALRSTYERHAPRRKIGAR